MNIDEARAAVGRLHAKITAEIPKATNKTDEAFGEMLQDGLLLLGELLIDIKRIADGNSVHFHPPAGSTLVGEGSIVMMKPYNAGEEQDVIAMLSLTGELGGKKPEETYAQFLRRLLDFVIEKDPQ